MEQQRGISGVDADSVMVPETSPLSVWVVGPRPIRPSVTCTAKRNVGLLQAKIMIKDNTYIFE